jgi:hypothetical protein
MLLCGLSAQAGTLQLGTPTVEAERYVFPVILQGSDTPVAAMDFRLQFDPAVFRPLAADPGSMALQSDKTVTANAPAPGEYVVVMMGFNQNGVEGGEIARIALERIDGGDSGSSRVALTDTTFSTWEGEEVASQGSERVVGLDGDVPEEPEVPQEPDAPEDEDPTEEVPGGVPVDTPDAAPEDGGTQKPAPRISAGAEAGTPELGATRTSGRNELAKAFQDAAAARAQLEQLRGPGSGIDPEGAGSATADDSESTGRVDRDEVAEYRTKDSGGIGTTSSEILTVESAEEEAIPRPPAVAAVLTESTGAGVWWVGLAAVGALALGLLLLRNRFFA